MERFNCITWGSADPHMAKNGLIAGGMVDGSLMIWDGYTLLNPDLGHEPLLCNIGLYEEQQFFSLEFNNFKKEWLATGGTDVYIANLENMGEEPDVFCPNAVENEFFVTSVSWNKNKSLPHILASGSSDGSVNVWDLKVKRSISSFRDSSGSLNRNTQVSWNPDLPTQIAVTFDEQDEAGLQIWDLRNSKAPVTVFNESHVGSAVHCLSWSNTNSRHILTGDRTGVVVVWDYKTNEIVKEENLGYEFLSAQWIPNLPSVYYVIGNDGKMNLHTIDQEQVNKISQSHAPKWMKNPVCGTTLGASTVVQFNNNGLDVTKKDIFIHTDLTQTVDSWNQLVETDDVDKLCDFEIQNAQSQESEDLWKLLKLAQCQPKEMLSALGFNHEEIIKKTEKFTGISHNKTEEEEGQENNNTHKRKFEYAQMDEDEAAAFFNQLSSNVQNDGSEEKEHKNITMNCFFNEGTEMEKQTHSVNVNWDAGAEDLIRRNLFVGNFRGALDCALKCERYAHAFLIAYAKKDDPELMQLAADSFALLIKDPVSNLLQNVINDKVEDIVDRYDLTRWKELASFIVTNYESRKGDLLASLSRRLLNDGNAAAAKCLALISQDFRLFQQLTLDHEAKVKNSARNEFLVRTFKKLLVLKQKTGTVYDSEKIQDMLVELAFVLIEQTHFKLAYTLLLELGDNRNNERVLSAMNTIYILYQPLLQLVYEPPASIIETYQLPSIGRQIPEKVPERVEEEEIHTPRDAKKGRWSRPGPAGGGRKPPAVHKTPKVFAPPKRDNTSRSTAGYDDSAVDNYSLQSDLDLDAMNKKLPIGKRIKSDKFKKIGPPTNTKGGPVKRGPRNIPKPGPPKPNRPVPKHAPAPQPAHHAPPPMPQHHHTPSPMPHHPQVEELQPAVVHQAPSPGPRPGPKRVPGPPGRQTKGPKPIRTAAPPGPRPGPGGRSKPPGPPQRSQKSVPSQESRSQTDSTNRRPAPRAPPVRGPPGPRAGPPSRKMPPGPPSRPELPTSSSQKSGPGSRPGPPGRPAPAPPAKNLPGPPPKRTGPAPPAKKAGPPTRSTSQQNVNQHQSDTIDYDTLFNSLEQAREFLEDIVEPNRVQLYQGYLDTLSDQINSNQLQSDVMDNLSQFFDCKIFSLTYLGLCENDPNGAKHYYKAMKKIANSTCREWLSVLDLILKNL